MFADMPLDNRTVNKMRGRRRPNLTFLGFRRLRSRPSAAVSAARNDLMFRHG
jgi:hypothetical protein